MVRDLAASLGAGPWSAAVDSPETVMKILAGLLIFGLLAWHFAGKPGLDHAASADLSSSDIQAIAADVTADEVVIYTTSECPYCAQAKGWLNQYGFAFTECNMSVERRCETELHAYGGDGTPYLVIRRGGKVHHMKDGFDSEEFLAAVRAN